MSPDSMDTVWRVCCQRNPQMGRRSINDLIAQKPIMMIVDNHTRIPLLTMVNIFGFPR